VPPPLDVLAELVLLDDKAAPGEERGSRRDGLYGLLRREQAIAASAQPSSRAEVSRILDFAQAAYGDVIGVLIGRDDSLLDSARDGEWSLRDVVRHAMAVELRYAVQVEYSVTRADADPVQIPQGLLPCDRLSPPESEFGSSRSAGVLELLRLLGNARASSDIRLARLPHTSLGRPSLWGEQRVDVRMRLHQIGVHLTETAIQIEKIVGSGGEIRAIIRRCCVARGTHERWSAPEERADLDESYHRIAPVSSVPEEGLEPS
jgi:hypothetical protein